MISVETSSDFNASFFSVEGEPNLLYLPHMSMWNLARIDGIRISVEIWLCLCIVMRWLWGYWVFYDMAFCSVVSAVKKLSSPFDAWHYFIGFFFTDRFTRLVPLRLFSWDSFCPLLPYWTYLLTLLLFGHASLPWVLIFALLELSIEIKMLQADRQTGSLPPGQTSKELPQVDLWSNKLRCYEDSHWLVNPDNGKTRLCHLEGPPHMLILIHFGTDVKGHWSLLLRYKCMLCFI